MVETVLGECVAAERKYKKKVDTSVASHPVQRLRYALFLQAVSKCYIPLNKMIIKLPSSGIRNRSLYPNQWMGMEADWEGSHLGYQEGGC